MPNQPLRRHAGDGVPFFHSLPVRATGRALSGSISVRLKCPEPVDRIRRKKKIDFAKQGCILFLYMSSTALNGTEKLQ